MVEVFYRLNRWYVESSVNLSIERCVFQVQSHSANFAVNGQMVGVDPTSLSIVRHYDVIADDSSSSSEEDDSSSSSEEDNDTHDVTLAVGIILIVAIIMLCIVIAVVSKMSVIF